MKDPTAWMDDLSVYLDDESVASMAAQQEPTATFAGSKLGVGLWTGLVGAAGGALGAITLSPDIRSSVLGFGVYLAGALVVFRGVGPATNRLFGPGIAWLAFTALFWGGLLGLTVAIGGRVGSTTLGYGISSAAGFFIGLVAGGLHPPFVKHENAWMVWSLMLAPASAMLGTALLRGTYARAGDAEAMLAAGALAAGAYAIPTGVLLTVLWDEAHGLHQTALLFLHNENFAAKAVAYLDRAIAIAPDDVRLYNLRGIAYSKLGRSDAARADWARVRELSPDDPDPLLNEGADYLRHGALDQAVEAFEGVLRLDETHARAHSNLGTALERKGNLDGALRHYDRAIALQPDYPIAFSNRAYTHHLRGDHRSAIADCDQAIRLDERLAMAHVNRGHALAAIGEPAAAIASYRAALYLEPETAIREEAMQGIERLGSSPDGPEPQEQE